MAGTGVKRRVGWATGVIVLLVIALIGAIGTIGYRYWHAESHPLSLDGQAPDAGASHAAEDRSADPADWFTGDDYPADALKRGEQGRVTFVLTIDTDGLPAGCAITSGSGYADLDEATCALAMAHAKLDAKPQPYQVTRSTRWAPAK